MIALASSLIRPPDPAVLVQFAPEIALIAASAAVLLHGVAARTVHRLTPLLIALAGLTAAAGLAAVGTPADAPLWGGWLVSDAMSLYARAAVYAAGAGTVLLALLGGFHRRPDAGSAEFSVLLLGASLGLGLMCSAEHLLMMYLALEMAGLPGYVLVGFRRTGKASAEAAIKFVVYGSAASAVMLYGLSLLYGLSGSLLLPDAAAAIARPAEGTASLAAAGVIAVVVGLAFKASAVPFHFWTPDVFEGAGAEVGAFLSTAAKAGAFALLLRFGLAVAGAVPGGMPVGAGAVVLADGLAVAAAAGMLLGALAAFTQTNLKRLLAYSVVSHSGFLLMGLAALTLPGADGRGTVTGAESVLAYAAVNVLMNLGAFGVVVLVRRATGSEDLDAFRGLGRTMPATAVSMTVFLLSLTGLPPLAGFFAKFGLFAALFASAHPEPRTWDVLRIGVIAAGVLATVLSLFVYARIIRVMWAAEPRDDRPDLRETLAAKAFCAAVAVPLVAAAVFWGPFAELTRAAAAGTHLSRAAPPAPTAEAGHAR
jgi:NADH-quinone oxidoreductase subunit N